MDEKISKYIFPDEEYPGCPFCKAKSFIVCETCGKLNCYNTDDMIFTCGWCGEEGELTDYEGEGFSSSGDI